MVANIGEQLPNADAKVFEVQIKVDGSDPILRPSMTTGNKIVTKTIDNVVYIPLECVQMGDDSIPVVYTKNRTKHIVVLGESNENNVIVEQGVEPGDVLYLSTPEKPENFRLVGEELKAVIKEREKARKEEEIRIRKEAEKALEERASMMGSQGMQQFGNMRSGGGNSQFGQGGGGQRTGNFGQGAGGQRAGGVRDTAAMRRIQQMRQQGDTAGMRRLMQQMRQQNGQQGARRDTTARRTQRQQEQQ
jgi:hypothetical protein